jgi:hypothetical protein
MTNIAQGMNKRPIFGCKHLKKGNMREVSVPLIQTRPMAIAAATLHWHMNFARAEIPLRVLILLQSSQQPIVPKPIRHRRKSQTWAWAKLHHKRALIRTIEII